MNRHRRNPAPWLSCVALYLKLLLLSYGLVLAFIWLDEHTQFRPFPGVLSQQWQHSVGFSPTLYQTISDVEIHVASCMVGFPTEPSAFLFASLTT
ncbi:hypothetical protein [Ferrimonas pelagia]|uniref:Uncharacterized protein n=1 Tax=Ferrimonas pelagia TaxID=1177826 RepID=A0ABP9EMJ7_9GAMM